MLLGKEKAFSRTKALNNTLHYFSALKKNSYLGKHITQFNISKRKLVMLTNIANTDSFPNVFTPNGDGVNDVFEIKGLDESKSYNLKIFNRWGQLMFETFYPQTTFWAGRTTSGILVPEGVYYYILTGENTTVSKGFVTVLN